MGTTIYRSYPHPDGSHSVTPTVYVKALADAVDTDVQGIKVAVDEKSPVGHNHDTRYAPKGDTHYFRGQLANGANWDSEITRGYVEWTKPGLSTYTGSLPPSLTEQGVLEVLRGASSWTTLQRATESSTGRAFVRAIRNPGTTPPQWYPWREQATASDAGGTTGTALSPNWLHIGDSLTDDVVLGPEQWGRYMSTLDGRAHEVRGWFNQETFEIATRMGATLYPVTVTGGSIPASGTAVTVTGLRTDQLAFGGYAGLMARTVPAWIGSRHGSLRNPTNTTSMQFTPDDGVSAATAAAGTQWVEGDLSPFLDRITTIWVGTNDRGEETPARLVSLVRQMVARLPHSRALVFGLFTDPNGTQKSNIDAINRAYWNAFPDMFFNPTPPLLLDQAFTDAGIVKTADDQTDIAAGFVPRSFRSDSIHLNDQGGIALAHAVHREAVARGWSV